MEQIGGIILAGGQSSRMGANKALIRLAGGPTLIEMVAVALQKVVARTILVTNTPDIYAWLDLPTVSDNFPQSGPLGGLEAGLSAAKFEYNLVVGCDMPYLVPALLQYLAAQVQPANAPLVVMPSDQQGRLQPLCALYSKHLLPLIRENLRTGHLKLLELLNNISVSYLVASQLEPFDPHLKSFVSLNRPEDLPAGARLA